jgi:5-formyltetrahydrofolate cyclo-ligase
MTPGSASEGLETKDDIRSEALRRRNSLSAGQRNEASLAICRGVMEDDLFLDARGLHVYLPFGTEVDIKPLIELSWEMGKEVGLMRVLNDGGIAHYSITPSTDYRRTKLGILEPVDAEPFDMNLCDLVIVPLLAADEDCNRLGYGKGYYDQFLAQYPRPALGVAFEDQIFPQLPFDDRDIKLDGIYTEKRFIGEE